MPSFTYPAPFDGSAVLPNGLIDTFLKLDGYFDADLIATLRDAAIGWVEKDTSIGLTKALRRTVFTKPGTMLRLTRKPVIEIVSISSAGVADTATQWASWSLVGDTLTSPGSRGWSAFGQTVTVDYVAGHEDCSVTAPGLRTAALMLLRHLYDGGDADNTPPVVRTLCDAARIPVMA